MHELIITVRGRVAEISGEPEIVCGNSDYIAVFDFDAEWDAYPVKTMRIVRKNMDSEKYICTDVLFEGNRAVIPPVFRTAQILLGVYAGDIRTTTPVRIPCCSAGTKRQDNHPQPDADVYAQLLALMKRLKTEQTYAGAVRYEIQGAVGISGIITDEEAV